MRAKTLNRNISDRARANWIMLIYFASGTCSLIDEVVWVRLLKLTLGNTVYASSIVVSVFMGGLAAGAMIMGRYSDRITRRLSLYALLETCITITALLLPFALKLADGLYVLFYQAYHPTHAQLLAVQVIISALILLVPSMLMGSTLPLLGRFVTALEKEAGHLVGRLYALNTLGAAVGCFLAGFFLIRQLGVMGALFTAAALNLLVAFGGWGLAHFSAARAEQAAEPTPVRKPDRIRTTDARFYVLILAFFFSGMISIGYELLWMRSIVHLLGGFTYVFSAVLTVYLIGNVIGAGIGSRLAKRLKQPAGAFAVTLAILGVCGVFYLPVLILWTLKILPAIKPTLARLYGWMGDSGFTIDPVLQSAFLFLAPAIIMGIGFPIALQAWANHIHKVGRSTGTAYGANTIGAVLGGILTGFILIPRFGVQISISILGLLGIWTGAIMWGLFSHRDRPQTRWAFLASAVFLSMLTFVTPSSLFEVVVGSSPIFRVREYGLVAVREGLTTTVSVHRDLKDGAKHLYSSGQSIAGDNYVERGDQKMLGHFGVLLQNDAKRVLSVGFGSGETTRSLSLHNLDRLDCVEIAPEVVRVSLEFFDHINLGEKLHDEVNMIFMDAKNYLHLTDTKYDVIINDSIHPRDFAENASLYTKEYFENARKRLDKNGMIISWLPTYNMPESVFNSIVGTLMEVFPHVTAWYLTTHPAPLVLLAASTEQQQFSPKRIEKAIDRGNVRENLSQINVYSSMELLCCYVADEKDLRTVTRDFSINSDYQPFVEFNTDLVTPQRQVFNKYVGDIRSLSVYDHIDWAGFNPQEKQRWLSDFQKLYEGLNYLLMAYGADDKDKLNYCSRGLRVIPGHKALVDYLAEVEKELVSKSVGMILSGRADEALALAEHALSTDPQLAVGWIIKSNVMLHTGKLRRALTAAEQAVQAQPDDANAHLNLGIVFSRTRHFEKAVRQYEQALRLFDKKDDIGDYELAQILDMLVSACAAAGRFEQAEKNAERAVELAKSTHQPQLAARLEKQLQSFKVKN